MQTPFFIIPRIGGIAYLNNPKAACSSVLLALSKMRRREGFQPPGHLLPEGSHPIHGFHPYYAHTEFFFRRWPLSYPPLPFSFIKFTFVRNPYARFYSFYKSKVLTGQAPGKFYERFGLEQKCSFEECVRIITSIDPQDLEHHAAPQSLLLCNKEGFHVDFIGKVEEFSTDWQVIKDITGFDLQLDRLNVIPTKDRPVFDEDIKDRIYLYYRDDFELFGYDRDSVILDNKRTDCQDKEVFGDHHLSADSVVQLKQKLVISNERIRRLAVEYSYYPEKREKFFSQQEELFRELLLKSNLVLEEKVKACSISQENIEKNTLELRRQVLSVRERQVRHEKKYGDIGKQVNDLAASNQFLSNVQKKLHLQMAENKEEMKQLRDITYGNILDRYRRSRKNPWKILCRFVRSPFLNEVKLLHKSGLVDPHYYFENYPHVISSGFSASEHYVHYGAQEGKNPSARFNTLHYFASHPDIVHAGINPLIHFIVNR